MLPKIVFLARIKDRSGKFPFVTVEIKKGRPVPIEGATSYYLRYSENGKRKTEGVGKNLTQAFVAFRNRELNLERARQGLAPIVDDSADPKRIRIADAVTEFCEEIVTLGKAKATRVAYSNAVKGFERSCTKTLLDQVTREDVVRHIDWLRQNLQRRNVGEQENTIRNRLRYLTVFLNRYGFKNPLPAKQWPKRMKKIPDKYSAETIKALLKAANKNERLIIEFFLYSGCRDEEAAHAEWGDINTRTNKFTIRAKPHFGWTPKDSEERAVRLPADFINRLLKLRNTRNNCSLIFPNGNCRPDTHLIRYPRRAAERAGITERITLHKFRRTIGSAYARKFGVRNAQDFLGHSNIETTERYLAADDLSTKHDDKAVENLFSEIANTD
jgi:integrase